MANPKYYLVTVAKEASMICFVDEDNAFVPLKKFHPQTHPAMVFPSAKAANNFAKTHALKQAQCVAEKTFTAKRILACSATEMTVSKEENALPKPVAVAISPEPKAAPMPINEIFRYGEEMCASYSHPDRSKIPGAKDEASEMGSTLFMQATAGQDFADSVYAQTLIETLGTLEKLMYATQYIQQEVPKYMAEMERQQNDEAEYAEYFRLDAVQGYSFYRRFREIRLQRRFWKDLYSISQVVQPILHSITIDQLHHVLSYIETTRNRVYKIRSSEAFKHIDRTKTSK